MSAALDFFHGDYAIQEQIAQGVPSAMPAQPIAARARRQAVSRSVRPAFVPLDDVILFPMSIGLLSPPAISKFDRISAKMAVAISLPLKPCPGGAVGGPSPVTGTLAAAGSQTTATWLRRRGVSTYLFDSD